MSSLSRRRRDQYFHFDASGGAARRMLRERFGGAAVLGAVRGSCCRFCVCAARAHTAHTAHAGLVATASLARRLRDDDCGHTSSSRARSLCARLTMHSARG
mmetsp:Transcript_25152/g.77533  ORF Transcript_25152/g.77533 Transcript_25152/m.77533 type:complete len:101 (+) Transcript_25152:494-796(+)